MEMDNYRCLNSSEILDVIKQAKHCMLGISENRKSYLTTMYYCWEFTDEQLNFILINKEQGEKMDFIKSNDNVSLEFEIKCKDLIKIVIADCEVTSINKEKCEFACMQISANSIIGKEYSY